MTTINRHALIFTLFALFLAAHSQAHAADPEAEIEKLVGKPVSESFKLEYGVVTDPTVNAWVSRVGHDVASQSPRQDIKYTFIIADTDLVNAFSVPGGAIFVTRGLLDNLDGDEELAGVLAHEVGHEYRYHGAKLLAGELALSLFERDALKPSSEVQSSALLLANVLALLSFSRHNESEADQSGVDFSSKASYDPRGLSEFFAQINETGKDRPRGIAELFETHPSTPDRIRRVTARIDRELTPADWKRIGDRLQLAGLYGKAAEVYAHGQDDLDRDSALSAANKVPGPDRPAAVNTPYLPNERELLLTSIQSSRKGLDRVFDANRINSALQQLLALSVTNRDVGMIALAAQAYSLQARAQSIIAEQSTITRTSPVIWMALGDYGALPPGSSDAVEASTAAGELSRCAQCEAEAVGPLRAAENELAGAMVDLDASAFGIGFKAERTAHYAALEAALLIATGSLDHAEKASDRGRKLLDTAHLRLLKCRLNRYPPSQTYTEIVAHRLSTTPEAVNAAIGGKTNGYGDLVVLASIQAEMVQPPPTIDSIVQPGKSPVDTAVDSGASVDSIELTARMVDRNFQSARTGPSTGALP